jgi:hypothetical protein
VPVGNESAPLLDDNETPPIYIVFSEKYASLAYTLAKPAEAEPKLTVVNDIST